MELAILSILTLALGAMVASTTALQIQTRNELRELSLRLADHGERVKGCEDRLDRLDERMGLVEGCLARVEERLDRVEERLDRVEARLARMEELLVELAEMLREHVRTGH